MGIPEGFDAYFEQYYLLLMLKTIYGLKQAAMAFWKQLLAAMRRMGFKRSGADSCLYFAWTTLGLVIWLSWIDDCLFMSVPEAVKKEKQKLMKEFDCTDEGELTKYVGCKITRNKDEGWLKFTQPVLLQSFADEFKTKGLKHYETPMETNKILDKAEPGQYLGSKVQTYF